MVNYIGTVFILCTKFGYYKSLNVNLRLILLAWVSKQLFDPKISIVYCGNCSYYVNLFVVSIS